MQNDNTTVYDALDAVLRAVSALEGTYPTAAPEGAQTPFCVYVQRKAEPIRALDHPTGVTEYIFDLHIVAPDYDSLVSTCAAVKDAVNTLPAGNGRCLDVEWADPNPEGYEPMCSAQRRIPSVTIMYYD